MPAQKQCPYCGQCFEKLTCDHVVPKCLFPEPLRKQIKEMITVPACRGCNSKKSKHDDFLRDLLVSDIRVNANSEIAQQIFQDKVLSSVRKDKSLLGKIVLKEAQEVTSMPELNLYSDDLYITEVSPDRVREMFSFIVRGIYYKSRKIVLPEDCRFEVQRLNDQGAENCLNFFKEKGCREQGSPHDHIFRYVYQHDQDDDASTFWLLVFYENIFYQVKTLRRSG